VKEKVDKVLEGYHGFLAPTTSSLLRFKETSELRKKIIQKEKDQKMARMSRSRSIEKSNGRWQQDISAPHHPKSRGTTCRHPLDELRLTNYQFHPQIQSSIEKSKTLKNPRVFRRALYRRPRSASPIASDRASPSRTHYYPPFDERLIETHDSMERVARFEQDQRIDLLKQAI
jgi:hypothetical protein